MLDNFQLIKAEIMLHDEENRRRAAVRARNFNFLFLNFFSLPSLSMHTRNLGQTVTVFSALFFFALLRRMGERTTTVDYIITTDGIGIVWLCVTNAIKSIVYPHLFSRTVHDQCLCCI